MRSIVTGCALAAASSVLVACATAPEAPLNAAPRLTADQLDGDPTIPYSEVIASAGAPTIASGPVRRGGVLVSSGYRYKHTAVLIEDVTGFSITVSGVQAPAGAPGYYAGTFVSRDTYANGQPSDLWCFLPQVVGGRRESLCLLRNQPGVAAIAPTRMNPWLWTEFAPATGTFDYVRAPVFEHRAVEIPGDLRIEYRFNGWNGNGARIEIWANGRKADDHVAPRSGSGSARLRTVAGDYDIKPGADEASATIIPAS